MSLFTLNKTLCSSGINHVYFNWFLNPKKYADAFFNYVNKNLKDKYPMEILKS